MSQTAKVNGTSLFYETRGEGFPVVFVSGGGILDRRGWDNQFETFAKHYRVVRYDIRGIGNSERPQDSFSHSKDLYALLTFLNITRAHVVGLSVGGAIALDFAIEHPEVVDCLILAAPGLSSDSKSETNLQGLKALTDLVKTNGLEKLIELTLDAPFVLSKQNDASREKVRQLYLDNADVFESGFPVYALWEPLQPPPEDRLATIEARVLIIRGDSDSPVYAAMTDKISSDIPHATTIVIPGGTHFLNLEKPAEFNEAMHAFLRH
jgi:pimeloyl-ACP methyl ester carboxylesterase